MARGSITDQDIDFVETWENIATSQNAVIKLDSRGDEQQEVIQGPRNFMLTTQERIITEDRIMEVKNNPFRNGSFRPVIVPDSVTVESNPNALSDAEIAKVLGSSKIAFDEWMSTIDSIPTLRRMLDLAEKDEDLSLARFRRIEDRVIEVRGTTRRQLEVRDPQLKEFLSDKSGSNARLNNTSAAAESRENRVTRRQGGRSSDYR